MGMQRSEELREVIQVVFEQFIHLDIKIEHAGFVVDYKLKGDWHFWIADENNVPSKITHPYFDSVWANQFNEAKEKGTNFFATHLNFEEKNKFYRELLQHVPGLEEKARQFYLNCPGLAISTVLSDTVALYIENFAGTPYSDEENAILIRFGNVFQQTYTRFLDLQKAEAQAHEAQIEASLERVRSSAMAMHNSDDLTGAASTVFTELNKLGIHSIRSGFVLLTRESRRAKLYPATSFDKAITLSLTGEFDFVGHPVFEKQYESWLKQENYFPVLEGETLLSYYRILSDALSVSFDQYLDTDKQFGCFLPFTDGFLFTWNKVPVSEEETGILSRFKTILDLTIRRYADLKKAEALVEQSLIEERKLREEKERADKLLLNILPEEIANELKQFGKSYARKHDEVTILFADIQGFSSIAETLSAQELVTQLDECFRAFDHIVEKHGLEKIKTVGDAYVCACGLPKYVPDHAAKTIRAAIDMMNFIKGFSITRTIQDLPAFEFRIGIHTGPVITGVVGLKKFTYDIWGDAVNMAARMEQHGEAGKINISESTYALIKDKFTCTSRGKIPAKNKGEVAMYFVEANSSL
jgi:class 3 adenylate cyclase